MAADSAPDPAWDFPEHWSPGAKDAFENVAAERPDLAGTDLALLEQVCEMISAADAFSEMAREQGPQARGSAGQAVANPLAVEARQLRTAAAPLLAKLAPSSESASNAGRALVRTRYARGRGR